MDWYPKPKSRPAMTGAIQWIVGVAVQASQKREMAIASPPMQETGSRCSSGLKGRNQVFLCDLARSYLRSQHMATRAVDAAPTPTEMVLVAGTYSVGNKVRDVRGRKASEVILMLKPYASGKMIG